MGSIHPEVPVPPLMVALDVEEWLRTLAIPDTVGGHDHGEELPEDIDEEMLLAAFDIFARVVAANPFCSGWTD